MSPISITPPPGPARRPPVRPALYWLRVGLINLALIVAILLAAAAVIAVIAAQRVLRKLFGVPTDPPLT